MGNHQSHVAFSRQLILVTALIHAMRLCSYILDVHQLQYCSGDLFSTLRSDYEAKNNPELQKMIDDLTTMMSSKVRVEPNGTVAEDDCLPITTTTITQSYNKEAVLKLILQISDHMLDPSPLASSLAKERFSQEVCDISKHYFKKNPYLHPLIQKGHIYDNLLYYWNDFASHTQGELFGRSLQEFENFRYQFRVVIREILQEMLKLSKHFQDRTIYVVLLRFTEVYNRWIVLEDVQCRIVDPNVLDKQTLMIWHFGDDLYRRHPTDPQLYALTRKYNEFVRTLSPQRYFNRKEMLQYKVWILRKGMDVFLQVSLDTLHQRSVAFRTM